MAQKLFPAGLGQSLDPNQDVRVAFAHLTSGSTAATAVFYSNGVRAIPMTAVTGSSDRIDPGVGPVSLLNLKAPVTVDVVGTGAELLAVW